MPDAPTRRHSPAAERNSAPILAGLRGLLPASGVMLEIASGTGQHAAAFAAALPGWTWWPTDAESAALPSIAAWCAGLDRVQPPRTLDVTQPHWSSVPAEVDAVYCANMVHIAPWACCEGLMAGAARHLTPTGVLIIYGPYLEDALPTSPGNQAFDADLRARHPAWGLRRREEVETVAARHGLRLRERLEMPANNLLLVWARDDSPTT